MTVEGEMTWLGSIDCDAVDEYNEPSCQCCHGGMSNGDSLAEVLASYRASGWRIDRDGYALCPHHPDGFASSLSEPSKCPLCDRVARDWAMKDHIRKVHHMSIAGAEAIAAGAEPHACESCDFIASSARNLGAHVRGAHREVTTS